MKTGQKKKDKRPQFKLTWHSSLIFKWHTSLMAEMALQPTVYWLICFYYLIVLDFFFYFRFVFRLSSFLLFITYVSKIWSGHILDGLCEINQNIPEMA